MHMHFKFHGISTNLYFHHWILSECLPTIWKVYNFLLFTNNQLFSNFERFRWLYCKISGLSKVFRYVMESKIRLIMISWTKIEERWKKLLAKYIVILTCVTQVNLAVSVSVSVWFLSLADPFWRNQITYVFTKLKTWREWSTSLLQQVCNYLHYDSCAKIRGWSRDVLT